MMKILNFCVRRTGVLLLGCCLFCNSALVQAGTLNISNSPLYLVESAPPLMMLVMSRDHKLYYEAYNDAADIDGDGVIDVGYKPSIDYYGYFDSYKCYHYANNRFEPVSTTPNKKCSGNWSGDFLNYVTTTRMDALRRALYGGYRSTDVNGTTVLERARIVQDAHSWGKEYLSIAHDGYDISDYTPLSAPTGGNRHLFANTTLLNGGQEPRMRVLQNVPYRIWEWVSIERPVAGNTVNNGTNHTVAPTDYFVRVVVCVSGMLEENCKSYPNGNAKPTGLLHKYGENDAMKFGLLTGSYTKNLSGGVVRKNINSFTDEVDPNTGIYTSTNGIVQTIDKLRMIGFGGSHTHQSNCGFIFNRKFNEGECRLWGNPIGEMMYEALRYYQGKSSPTPAYHFSQGGDDAALGLPLPTWQDPYANGANPKCAKPNMLVISDVNPSFDSDQLPGSYFSNFTGDISPSMNVQTLAQTIWNTETGGGSKQVFIGQAGTVNDESPNKKTVSTFGNIRGLAPEEPSKEGSYYSASVAYYGHQNDINSVDAEQKVNTFAMTFASPVAVIPINAGGQTITIAPFARSVGGCMSQTYFPTNTIVDFYVDTITPTSGTFRINYEDAEQGADHDMDAIVTYQYVVNPDNTVSITLTSIYAAGCIVQHMGYVISGTTADGTYLEVRDSDTGAGNDPDYFLDTPPGQAPGGNWNDGNALPLTTTRTFTPASSGSESPVLKNPLWYAAKWGSFKDINSNNVPDDPLEWDVNNDGVPDNYFFVSRPQLIEAQLTALLDKVIAQSSSSASSAVSSSSLNTDTRIYQAIFDSSSWYGSLISFPIDVTTGQLITTGSGPQGSEWDAGVVLNGQHWSNGREIFSYRADTKATIKFRWGHIGTAMQNALHTNPDTSTSDSQGQARLQYIRGNRSLEDQFGGGSFRDRVTVLGDIVSSHPVYVAGPEFPYGGFSWPAGSPEAGAAVNYFDFKSNNTNRTKMVYVGANDGMLHGFNAVTGQELMAYIPAYVIPRLNKLTSADYEHEFYVDGAPNVGDAYLTGKNSWRTILASGLNKGGQAIFALDITDPSVYVDENNHAQVVLWEFSDADDADLGYTYSQPQIVRMKNGKWAAVFGNGYNNTEADGNASTTGNAVLYIVDLETGVLIRKIDTGVGMAQDPMSQGRPNGLSTPAVADVDGDYISDYIYAGDLFGNVWKFDVRDPVAANWSVSFSGSPLFVATDGGTPAVRQAITSQPSLAGYPDVLNGVMVFVGTGKYLEPIDKVVNNVANQTFYAIEDDHTTPVVGRALLLQQQILAEITIPNTTTQVRVTTENAIQPTHRGWYLDLTFSGNNKGERTVTDSIFRDNKIIFTTLIPSDEVCAFGGDGWLMELDAFSGSRLEDTPFDVNGDGIFSSLDLVNYSSNNVPVSGIKSSSGIIQAPSIVSDGTREYKYSTTSSGTIDTILENPPPLDQGRQSWHQLR